MGARSTSNGTPNQIQSETVIYIQFVADREGRGFSKEQIGEIVKCMREYIDPRVSNLPESTRRRICAIDSWKTQWKQAWTNSGKRKFLMVKPGKPPCAQRRTNVETYCGLLESFASSYEDPARFPFRYVGYSEQAMCRLDDHQLDQNSNYFKGLVQAIANVLWPDRYGLYQFVIHAVYRHVLASVAEIIFSQLAKAYATSGSGFGPGSSWG